MTAKSRYIHDRKQHFVENALGVGDEKGEGGHADSAEGAVAGNDNRRRWVELRNVLILRLDVTDEVTLDEVRRCPAVQSQGNFSGPEVAEPARNE